MTNPAAGRKVLIQTCKPVGTDRDETITVLPGLRRSSDRLEACAYCHSLQESKHLTSDYCPVSLFSIFCKVLQDARLFADDRP